MFSIGMSARLAPLSMATWSGSVSERTRLDVALDAHVAEDEQRRLGRGLAQRRVGGDEEGDAELGLDAVPEQVDHLDVEVGGVELAGDAELDLLRLQVAEGALTDSFIVPLTPPASFSLPVPVDDGDLDPVEADGAVAGDAAV